ncbi:MAG: hypothetical protein ABI811_15790 [Acidobacteriota bacterium]
MKPILALLALSTGALFAQTPTITEVLNNYGLINPGTVAQGAIFIVKGSNLADTTDGLLHNVPLQTTLFGVQMKLVAGGTTLFVPLYYVLPQQLAGIMPSAMPEGPATLTVLVNGRTSAGASVNVVKSAFGMLTLNGAGTGGAAVHNQDYVLLSNSNTTNPGKNVVFYGSGVGPTRGDETVAQTGINASGDLTTISISVEIGGKAAQVLYHGRTIYPGLDQINVVIPTLDSNTYSCTVTVVIKTNNVSANIGTIPVAPSGTTCTTGGGGGNNGGGTSINPTQSEINSWISRGSYTAGGITLSRSTTYSFDILTGAPSTTKADSFSAQFTRYSGADLGRSLRGELPPGYPVLNPTAGSCVVYNITGLTDPYPLLSYVNLDAGPQLTSIGPNGTLLAPRGSQQVTGFTYNANNVPNNYLAAGNYALSGPGGADVNSFSGTLTTVADLVVTNNASDFTTINRSGGFTVRWTGGEPSTFVSITGQSVAIDLVTSAATGAAFICIQLASAGQFTVPGSILSQLPASSVTVIPGFGSLITRGGFGVTAAGKGARFSTPSNVDIMTANNYWIWTYSPQYQ